MRPIWLLILLAMPAVGMAEEFESLSDSGFAIQLKDRLVRDAFTEDEQDIAVINLRPYYGYQPDKNNIFFIKANFYASNITGGDDTSIRSRQEGESFVEIPDFWWQHDFSGDTQNRTRIGRQKFDDKSGLWWDAPLTGASYIFDSTLLQAYVNVGDRSSYLRTDWGDDDPVSSSALYLVSQLNWQWKLDHFLITRAAYRRDRDNDYQLGTVYSNDLIVTEPTEGGWVGVEIQGEQRSQEDRYPRYFAEAAWAQGSRVRYGTAATSPYHAYVNTRSESDFQGYLLRAGFDYVWQFEHRWVLGVNALYASGGDGVDGGFSQTGLNTNRNALYTTNLHSSLTGETMHIALSNVQIVDLHAAYSYQGRHEVFVATRQAWRADADAEILLEGRIPANGSNEIGTSIDVAYGWYLLAPELRKGLQLSEFRGIQLMVYYSQFFPEFDNPGKPVNESVVGGKFIWAF